MIISNHKLSILIVFALLSIVLSSCQKGDDTLPENLEENITSKPYPTGMLRFGKKLENPYSVFNMKKAWENINQNPENEISSSISIAIKPTHLYLKFKPKNDQELSVLKHQEDLDLYSYPLDYEIKEGGAYYIDPEIQEGVPTYQYAAYPIDKELPKVVEYEILEELFIPNEFQSYTIVKNGNTIDILDLLEEEALKITGNQEVNDSNIQKMNRRWTPAGRIMVWDDVVNRYVPVVDLEVKARRWFTTRKGKTNVNGFYRADGTFKKEANYSIAWEKYEFSIRSGTIGQAILNGPKRKGDWNVNLGQRNSTTVRDKQQYYALIFQAARDYYYGNRFGLDSPPKNGTLNPQTKIAADITERQNEKPSHAAIYARTGGFLPTIYARTWERSAERVYAVTAHELAHYSHWNLDRNAFRLLVAQYLINNSTEAVIESWAEGVEWSFAQERYRNLFGIANYNYNNGNQNRRLEGFTNRPNDLLYTSLVMDLIDNNNQRATNGNSLAFPLDRVSGYSIRQIEQALKGSTSWNQWRNNMISLHNNATENRVNELFGNWY
ncbi:hypothetical protein [uncultured Aquimarina sp.]|uniref:hypothetical protein n=1 Tax=uncultured Aquimarina sp. TaxID=575652 RepID=UPI00260554D3|nr:hypothetical protein [uncultured Aquimarina sp.]